MKNKIKTFKPLSGITTWFKKLNELLISVFVFTVISGLLFNDPFGVIKSTISLVDNIGDGGIVGLITMLIILLWYKKY